MREHKNNYTKGASRGTTTPEPLTHHKLSYPPAPTHNYFNNNFGQFPFIFEKRIPVIMSKLINSNADKYLTNICWFRHIFRHVISTTCAVRLYLYNILTNVVFELDYDI